jgi:hypothetical protein
MPVQIVFSNLICACTEVKFLRRSVFGDEATAGGYAPSPPGGPALANKDLKSPP